MEPLQLLEAGVRKPCPRGSARNPSTKRCRKSCKKNQMRSKLTGNCILKSSKNRSKPRSPSRSMRRSRRLSRALRLPRPALMVNQPEALSNFVVQPFGSLSVPTFENKLDVARILPPSSRMMMPPKTVEEIQGVFAKDVAAAEKVLQQSEKDLKRAAKEKINKVLQGQGDPATTEVVNIVGPRDAYRIVAQEITLSDAIKKHAQSIEARANKGPVILLEDGLPSLPRLSFTPTGAVAQQALAVPTAPLGNAAPGLSNQDIDATEQDADTIVTGLFERLLVLLLGGFVAFTGYVANMQGGKKHYGMYGGKKHGMY